MINKIKYVNLPLNKTRHSNLRNGAREDTNHSFCKVNLEHFPVTAYPHSHETRNNFLAIMDGGGGNGVALTSIELDRGIPLGRRPQRCLPRGMHFYALFVHPTNQAI